MFFARKVLTAVAAIALSAIAVAVGGANQRAMADDGICFGNAGNLCRTVTIEQCTEWALNSITGQITGVGMGTTCQLWVKTTYYYYYDSAAGPPSGGTGVKK